MYSKRTHTNLYIDSSSHHRPSNKHVVISTLINRALCDEASLQSEFLFMRDVFRASEKTRFSRFPNLCPYVGSIFNRISKMLSRLSIKYVSSFLQPVKDDL
jgi:hypothetical protein